MTGYDLFVSYRRKDVDRVSPMVAALRECGLRVWFDQSEIREFAPITDSIRKGLDDSKAFLAWYSADYPKSRPCQMELTAAFIAAEQAGDVRERVLVVNPEPDTAHVLPAQLVDEQHLPGDQPNRLAALIAKHVGTLRGTLGATVPSFLPPQYGRKLVSAGRFVGRLPDLWKIHSALHGRETAIVSGSYDSAVAVVSGLGGAGKSMLAEEYALRFAAAYPGGIFWLRALGSDYTRASFSTDQHEGLRQEQIMSLARAFGVPGAEQLQAGEVEAALGRMLCDRGPFLWVVDDLPSGRDADAFRRWLAPAPPGKTLVTTRTREYRGVGVPLVLEVLPRAEAIALLTARRTPTDAAEHAAALCMVEDLGRHPLALEVAGAALKAQEGLRTFTEFRADLANRNADELEFAADPQTMGMLPTGHERSVGATLLRSLRRLGADGRDVLRLASVLAVAPIPARLVALAFAGADNLDEVQARRRVSSAVGQLDQASLTTRPEDGAVAVHALVSRTMRFSDDDLARTRSLRAAVVSALNTILPSGTDVRNHPDIVLEVMHARELLCVDIAGVEAATLASWVARYDTERGAWGLAEALEAQVLAVRRRLLGDNHPDTCNAMDSLAASLFAQDDIAGARALQEEAVAVSRRVLGDEHPDTLRITGNLTRSLREEGDVNGARALQEQILAVSRRVLGDEHPLTLDAMAKLALSLSACGNMAGALALQEQVVGVSRRVLGDDHPETLIYMVNLALFLNAEEI